MSVWLLTGSSRGLCPALAETVLAAGHQLIAITEDPTRLVGLVHDHGDRIRVRQLDATDEQGGVSAVRLAVDTFGRLDVLVNNAGYCPTRSIEDTSLADFRAQLDSDLFRVIDVTKAAIPLMREQGSGHIIQIGMIGARLGPPGWAACAAARWGVEGFSEVLSREVAPLGIKVTILEPGELRIDPGPLLATNGQGRAEYDDTVGAAVRFEHSCRGREPGDPIKAAKVILHIAELVDPPARLVLGHTALRSVARATLARIENDQRWRHLSLATDFVDPAQLMPLDGAGNPADITLDQAMVARFRPRTSAARAPSAAKAAQTSNAV